MFSIEISVRSKCVGEKKFELKFVNRKEMKVFLTICISVCLIQEVVPSTLVRLPRHLTKQPSLVQTEYEAKYEQTGKHGNESSGIVSGKQEIVHDNCAENWNEFAEKCASLIKDLVASLANAVSSKPGDATNLQLQIKNTFKHFDSTHKCTCLKRSGKNISEIDLSPLFNNISVTTVSPNDANCTDKIEEGKVLAVDPTKVLDRQKQPNQALDDVENFDVNPENADAIKDQTTNNIRRQAKLPKILEKKTQHSKPFGDSDLSAPYLTHSDANLEDKPSSKEPIDNHVLISKSTVPFPVYWNNKPEHSNLETHKLIPDSLVDNYQSPGGQLASKSPTITEYKKPTQKPVKCIDCDSDKKSDKASTKPVLSHRVPEKTKIAEKKPFLVFPENNSKSHFPESSEPKVHEPVPTNPSPHPTSKSPNTKILDEAYQNPNVTPEEEIFHTAEAPISTAISSHVPKITACGDLVSGDSTTDCLNTEGSISGHLITEASTGSDSTTDCSDTDASTSSHLSTKATAGGYLSTGAANGGHSSTEAYTSGHLSTEATTSSDSTTDCSDTDASTSDHLSTKATTGGYLGSKAATGSHLGTEAYTSGHLSTEATTGSDSNSDCSTTDVSTSGHLSTKATTGSDSTTDCSDTDASTSSHLGTKATTGDYLNSKATTGGHLGTEVYTSGLLSTEATIGSDSTTDCSTTDASTSGHLGTKATTGGYLGSEAATGSHLGTEAYTSGHLSTEATIGSDSTSDCSTTDASTSGHLGTEAYTSGHLGTEATTGGDSTTDCSDTDASTSSHLGTKATTGGYLGSEATTGGHLSTGAYTSVHLSTEATTGGDSTTDCSTTIASTSGYLSTKATTSGHLSTETATTKSLSLAESTNTSTIVGSTTDSQTIADSTTCDPTAENLATSKISKDSIIVDSTAEASTNTASTICNPTTEAPCASSESFVTPATTVSTTYSPTIASSGNEDPAYSTSVGTTPIFVLPVETSNAKPTSDSQVKSVPAMTEGYSYGNDVILPDGASSTPSVSPKNTKTTPVYVFPIKPQTSPQPKSVNEALATPCTESPEIKPAEPGLLLPTNEGKSPKKEDLIPIFTQPTTFQTTSADPTESSKIFISTTLAPQNSDETSPLTSAKSTENSEDDDDDEDCCSCESCTEEEISDPKQYKENACKNLEEAKRELKAIFDKIKKKLKCGRKAPQSVTPAGH